VSQQIPAHESTQQRKEKTLFEGGTIDGYHENNPKNKGAYMKRLLLVLLLGLFSLTWGSHHAYAETGGPIGNAGWGLHEEGMPMMRPMGHHGMGVMEAEHPMWRHLMDLGIDEKQREEIKEIKSRVTKDSIRKRADLDVARVELREVLDKDPVDINAAEAKLKKTGSLLTDIQLSHIKALEEVKAKLTPEQKKKFKEVLERNPMMGEKSHGGMKMPTPREKKEGDNQPIR
jgi:Spy/CpxP family protein refolding chaperone